jgi:hypothetical protein
MKKDETKLTYIQLEWGMVKYITILIAEPRKKIAWET